MPGVTILLNHYLMLKINCLIMVSVTCFWLLEKKVRRFISWDEIAGLRNRIAHDYRGIDRNIVFQIVKNEMEILQNACEKLLQQLQLPTSELRDLLKSSFFKHLHYLLEKQ